MKKIVLHTLFFLLLTVFLAACSSPGHQSLYEKQRLKLKEKPLPKIKYDLETKVRIYLHEKFHPGDCFGMPGPPDNRMVTSVLNGNEKLVEIIKQKYNVDERHEIYSIVRSINAFKLEKVLDGYKVKFVDGDCCTITTFEGFVYLINENIVRTEMKIIEVKNVPC